MSSTSSCQYSSTQVELKRSVITKTGPNIEGLNILFLTIYPVYMKQGIVAILKNKIVITGIGIRRGGGVIFFVRRERLRG